MAPVVSIVIPAFNRIGPLNCTLASAVQALRNFGETGEIILVDDGSDEPVESNLLFDRCEFPLRVIRQTNQGSIASRQNGLALAQGEFILFLDSDDLISPDKLLIQIESLRTKNLDVVYSDMAIGVDGTGSDNLRYTDGEQLDIAVDSADFYLRIQPAPHNPIYRRDYLCRHLSIPLIPPNRQFDAVGDVWLYYNLCAFTARIEKVDGFLAAKGAHNEDRFSLQWERLAVAALRLMEAFEISCPSTIKGIRARTVMGECAFASWRRLPRGFDAEFIDRMFRLWRRAPPGSLDKLGGKRFQLVARIIGPANAGRLFRYHNQTYSRVRTCSKSDFSDLFRS